jgi:hypothetical protein
MSFYYLGYTKYRLKCPHCGVVFQTTLDNGAIRLGPGIRTCHVCKGDFSDGSLEWPESTAKEKRKFLFRGQPWFVAFFGVVSGLLVYMGITDPKTGDAPFEFAAGTLAVGAALLAVFYLICWAQIILSKRRYRSMALKRS